MLHPYRRRAVAATLVRAGGLLFSGLLLGGCGQEESQGSLEPPMPPALVAPRFRAVHAAALPAVNVVAGTTQLVTNLSYLHASEYRYLWENAGRRVGFAATNPPGTIAVAGADLQDSTDNTLILVGDGWWEGFKIIMLADDNSAPSAGNAKIRLFNGVAYSALDFYVTPPQAELAGAAPTLRLEAAAASSYLQLIEGEYRVRAVDAVSHVLVMDTGTLQLRAGQVRSILTIQALDATRPGLLVLDDASY